MSSSSSAAAPAGVGYDPNAASESSSSSSADMTPLGVESMGQFFAYLGRTATVAHVHASFVVARMRTRTHSPASPPHAAAHAIPPASKRAVPRRAAPRRACAPVESVCSFASDALAGAAFAMKFVLGGNDLLVLLPFMTGTRQCVMMNPLLQ